MAGSVGEVSGVWVRLEWLSLSLGPIFFAQTWPGRGQEMSRMELVTTGTTHEEKHYTLRRNLFFSTDERGVGVGRRGEGELSVSDYRGIDLKICS